MELTLSKHTRDEIEKRGILVAYMERTIADPVFVGIDPTDSTLLRSYRPVPEFGNRVLRVVHRPTSDHPSS